MGVARHLTRAIGETHTTRIAVAGTQHTLLQADETLNEFERRARRVLSLDSAVELWLTLVVEHRGVVVVTLTTHHKVGVVGWRRDHHKNLTRRGLYGHHSANLTNHKFLGKLLQASIDSRG